MQTSSIAHIALAVKWLSLEALQAGRIFNYGSVAVSLGSHFYPAQVHLRVTSPTFFLWTWDCSPLATLLGQQSLGILLPLQKSSAVTAALVWGTYHIAGIFLKHSCVNQFNLHHLPQVRSLLLLLSFLLLLHLLPHTIQIIWGIEGWTGLPKFVEGRRG